VKNQRERNPLSWRHFDISEGLPLTVHHAVLDFSHIQLGEFFTGHGIARKTFLGDGNTVGRVVELALQEDEADGGGRVILDFSFHDKDLASMSVFQKEGLRAVKDPQLRGFRRS